MIEFQSIIMVCVGAIITYGVGVLLRWSGEKEKIKNNHISVDEVKKTVKQSHQELGASIDKLVKEEREERRQEVKQLKDDLNEHKKDLRYVDDKHDKNYTNLSAAFGEVKGLLSGITDKLNDVHGAVFKGKK